MKKEVYRFEAALPLLLLDAQGTPGSRTLNCFIKSWKRCFTTVDSIFEEILSRTLHHRYWL